LARCNVGGKVQDRTFASMLARRTPASLMIAGAIALLFVALIVLVAVSSSRIGPFTPGGTPDQVPAADVSVTGTVGTQTNAQGETEYTLTTPDGTLLLDAGPAWFFGDAYPLAAFVGKQVTIGGERREGSTQVDVRTIDGTALREPGKPPWAGGWKVVGEQHPGWSQEKVDRQAAKQTDKTDRFGLDCWPPGHCKDASGKPATPSATSAP
jgi:hypothetical protein